ncbi:hypothetical protein PAXRUDRAFT_834368 [Paxillus rubicundulus Ve08.2h10]|uniref:Uncharacterized protein n=1 Tax=Paxillus rubicundulus Ve08.2h10 TaxID=930991 RepID=A0A0D0C7C9_9AGAM|nr:hypothetical protein PAXRUDRAFT_834368 [Paxillus rubicundulus Ve08.2h10]
MSDYDIDSRDNLFDNLFDFDDEVDPFAAPHVPLTAELTRTRLKTKHHRARSIKHGVRRTKPSAVPRFPEHTDGERIVTRHYGTLEKPSMGDWQYRCTC